ncbi:MAG TPA: hypothetical protein VJ741_09665 [Solirubrobacteraceae bacterium]|nr:hypothetical protein [Solirubrobacteraceae bacterium]
MGLEEWRNVDLQTLLYQTTEAAGPLNVWYGLFLLGSFPWHTHAHVDERGNAHLLDLRTGRWFREFAAGTWTVINHSRRT